MPTLNSQTLPRVSFPHLPNLTPLIHRVSSNQQRLNSSRSAPHAPLRRLFIPVRTRRRNRVMQSNGRTAAKQHLVVVGIAVLCRSSTAKQSHDARWNTASDFSGSDESRDGVCGAKRLWKEEQNDFSPRMTSGDPTLRRVRARETTESASREGAAQ